MSSRTSSSHSSTSSSTHTSSSSKSKSKHKSSAAYTHHSLRYVSKPYATDLHARTSNLSSNNSALRKQEAELGAHTAALSKQRGQWQKLADDTTRQLKEFGDVQNWAECMERDFLVLEETLRLVEGRQDQGLASGTHGWK